MKEAPPSAIAVLIVDDEALVRIGAAYDLEEAGYKVYEASDAAKAITMIEKYPDIRVIFTDVNMPGSMDGIKLAHYVRGRWPPIEIIVTSGLGIGSAQQLPARSSFLAKPYRTENLLRCVREAANSRPNPTTYP